MNQHIEGVPIGCKLVRIGVPEVGWFFLDTWGKITKCKEFIPHLSRPIIASDNVYSTIDLTEVAIPEGYERDGDRVEEWFREVDDESSYVGWRGMVRSSLADWPPIPSPTSVDKRRIILRKIAPKTKRVLVIEVEAPECYNLEKLPCIDEQFAHSFRGTLTQRIETRPI